MKAGHASSEFDVIVVGSGPGGATAALELSRLGKNVLLLEKGKNHQNLGTYRGALSMLDKGGFLKSMEGVPLLKATTTGGATMVYSGSAAMPPDWLKTRHGVDLDEYALEAWRELNVNHLPEELLGDASKRVMDTANRLGYHWETSPKLLDISKFKKGRCCGAKTSLGCTCGAKWTARDSIREAVSNGAILMTRSECTNVLTINGQAVGVTLRTPEKRYRNIYAETVILAAGGIPSPVLLQRSGIDDAGDGCFIDPTQLIYGISPHRGSHTDPLVSVVTWEYYDSHGIRLGTLIDPRLMTCFNMAKAGPRHIMKAFMYHRMVGILVKVKDEMDGWVDEKGRVSKALTSSDLQKLDFGKEIAAHILTEMGCRPGNLVSSPIRGAHPSGTCRIGHVVDTNLQTPIKNLYVCDASVFPEALDRPTVITLVALAKRLSDHLTGRNRFAKNTP